METDHAPAGRPPDQPEPAPRRSPPPTADRRLPTAHCPLPTHPPTPCRLLIDPPASGPWNMATDEWLMEWSAVTGGCGWRMYAWQEPTLSLGYFQAYEDRRGHATSLGCPVVRRMSGGGAIVHDAELTYSFAIPQRHPLTLRRRALYCAVHNSLIEALSRHGIRACLCERPDTTPPWGLPFLCFLRRAPGDVLLGSDKIAGSAQRRSAGAVLQHGSVLLARSPAAPEIEGLQELTKRPLGQSLVQETWLEALCSRLGLNWYEQPLSRSERGRVAQLVDAKYATEAWTLRRRRKGLSGSPPTRH